MNTYCPLVLQHTQGNRMWRLQVQSQPVPQLVFDGDAPTLEEIVQVLGAIYAPAWLVPVVQVLIHVAVTSKVAQAPLPPELLAALQAAQVGQPVA